MSDSVMFDVFRVPVPTVHNGDVFVSNNASVVVVSARNFLVKPEFGTLVDTKLTVNAAASFLNTLAVTSMHYAGANSLVSDVLTQPTYSDYTHAGLAQAGVLQLLPTQNATLLGIDAPALEGTGTRVLIVQNLAAGYSITLAHANTQSAEGNRFTLASNTAVVIPGSGSVQLVWSTETKDWRVLGGASGGSATGDANNALFLNGQPGSYYTNATNITTGTLANTRLTGTYAISVTGTAYGKAEAALNANSALYANNATYAFGKSEGNLNVNNAVTAGYATTAGSATSATTALTANNATYAFGKSEGNLNVNNARQTRVEDTQGTDYAPNAHNVGVQWDFRTKTVSSIPGSGTFAAVQTVAQWSDTSGGYRHQLAITDDNDLYIRQATSNTAWSTDWRKFYHTGNMPTANLVVANLETSGNVVMNSTTQRHLVMGDQDATPAMRIRLWSAPNANTGGLNSYDDGAALYKQLQLEGAPLLLNYAEQGNVGVGTATPAALLHVERDGSYWGENGPLKVSSRTTPAKQMNIGYDATNDYGYISVVHSGVAWKPLYVHGPLLAGNGLLVSGTTTANGALLANGAVTATNLSLTTQPHCHVYRTGGTGLAPANNTTVAIDWDLELYDTTGSMHDVVTNNSRIVAPVDGYYLVVFQNVWNVAATGIRKSFIRVNGTEERLKQEMGPGPVFTHNTSGVMYLTAGQYIEACAYQTSGAALSTAWGYSQPWGSFLSMTKLF